MSIITIPILGLVTFVNFIIDPANIFAGPEYVRGIAAILSKGSNVDNIANYDERLLQEQLLVNMNSVPDIVVLGSSRIMEIGKDFYPGKEVTNCGVSHANIRDLTAIIGLLDSLKKMPKEILFNVEPGLIGKFYSSEWQSLTPYFNYFIRKYASANAFETESGKYAQIKKATSLFSFEYFQSSISFLLKGKNKKYKNIGTEEPLTYGRHSDGTVAYSVAYKNPDTVRVANSARLTGKSEGMPEPDSMQLNLFSNLVDVLLRRNVKITFCMLPFHQNYYDEVNRNYGNSFARYEEYFRVFAKKNSINILGGFDPRPNNVSSSEFYDMYHCSVKAISSVLKIPYENSLRRPQGAISQYSK